MSHPGNEGLLVKESSHLTNRQVVRNFTALFVGITVSSAVSCYLNYQFTRELVESSFIMLVCAIAFDVLVLRQLLILIVSFTKWVSLKLTKDASAFKDDQK